MNYPIDPSRPVPREDVAPMAPLAKDDDPFLEGIEQGMEEAENERREVVADSYEASARESEDPEEALDDIDYTLAEESEDPPELAALRLEDEPEP